MMMMTHVMENTQTIGICSVHVRPCHRSRKETEIGTKNKQRLIN